MRQADPYQAATWRIMLLSAFRSEPLIAELRNSGISLQPENFVVATDSGVVMLGFLKAGFDISLLPSAMCEREQGLERILPDTPPREFPIWLVTHRELKKSRRIRIVFDQLVGGLAATARV
jgi:DNA-binding transcriptional LysR family regulator